MTFQLPEGAKLIATFKKNKDGTISAFPEPGFGRISEEDAGEIDAYIERTGELPEPLKRVNEFANWVARETTRREKSEAP